MKLNKVNKTKIFGVNFTRIYYFSLNCCFFVANRNFWFWNFWEKNPNLCRFMSLSRLYQSSSVFGIEVWLRDQHMGPLSLCHPQSPVSVRLMHVFWFLWGLARAPASATKRPSQARVLLHKFAWRFSAESAESADRASPLAHAALFVSVFPLLTESRLE